MHDVTITVAEGDGTRTPLTVPTDMNLSVMEVLKASDYPVLGTCGGLALCATCHVEVLVSHDLPEPRDAELDMLDTLPNLTAHSRLSCQLPITPALTGLVIRLVG